MQSLGSLGTSVGQGALSAYQGAKQFGQGVLGQGGGVLGTEMAGPTQSGAPLTGLPGKLQGIAPYLNDFLSGQGIAGNMLSKGLGFQQAAAGDMAPGLDNGILGALFGNMRQGGGLGLFDQLAQGGMGKRGVIDAPLGPSVKPEGGFVQGLIKSYTGGLVGGH